MMDSSFIEKIVGLADPVTDRPPHAPRSMYIERTKEGDYETKALPPRKVAIQFEDLASMCAYAKESAKGRNTLEFKGKTSFYVSEKRVSLLEEIEDSRYILHTLDLVKSKQYVAIKAMDNAQYSMPTELWNFLRTNFDGAIPSRVINAFKSITITGNSDGNITVGAANASSRAASTKAIVAQEAVSDDLEFNIRVFLVPDLMRTTHKVTTTFFADTDTSKATFRIKADSLYFALQEALEDVTKYIESDVQHFNIPVLTGVPEFNDGSAVS